MNLLERLNIEALTGAALPIAVLGVLALYGWLVGSAAFRFTITLMFINVIFVVALQAFTGNSGVLSFGSLTFAAVGAYVGAILTLDPTLKLPLSGLPGGLRSAQLPFFAAGGIAVAAAGILAILIGVLILRLNGPSLVIAIFAMLLISNVVLNGWTGVTQGPGGLYAVPRETTIGIAFGLSAFAIVWARYFRESSMGLQLRTSRDDVIAAGASGVRVREVRLVAWVMSAMMSAAGGFLLGHLLTAFTPSTFYLSQTFTVVVMLVVGGMNTVSGAVLGTIIVTAAQELLQPLEGASVTIGPLDIERLTGITQAAFVLMILAVMYFRPNGIMGYWEADIWLKRALRAARRRRE